jgi:hypothetical protein
MKTSINKGKGESPGQGLAFATSKGTPRVRLKIPPYEIRAKNLYFDCCLPVEEVFSVIKKKFLIRHSTFIRIC